VRLRLAISLNVALTVCAADARADYLVLRSGARLNVSAYQLLGDHYHIQINGGSAEIAAADVVAIEPEEIFVPAPRMPLTQAPFGELIRSSSQKYGVDADLLFSVIAAESNFNSKSSFTPRRARTDAALADDRCSPRRQRYFRSRAEHRCGNALPA